MYIRGRTVRDVLSPLSLSLTPSLTHSIYDRLIKYRIQCVLIDFDLKEKKDFPHNRSTRTHTQHPTINPHGFALFFGITTKNSIQNASYVFGSTSRFFYFLF